jgi:branched-chain amino acid transport system substrate-binding protein
VLAVAAGATLLDAARLAVEDEMTLGPVPGLDTVMALETSNLSAPALEIASRLVDVPGLVAVVGHSNSASSLVASQVYSAREVVQIAPTSTAVSYSEAGPFNYRLVPPDDRQGPFLAEVLTERHPDGARVAVFYVNDDYGRGLRAAVLTALDDSLFPVVLQLPHTEAPVDEAAVRRGLDALHDAAPDLVLWLGRPQVLESFLPGIRETRPDLTIYGGDALSRVLTGAPLEGFWSGLVYTDFLDPLATEASRAFVTRYRARFGAEAGGPEILVYDAVRVVLQGLREGARSGEALRRYLDSLGRERPPFLGLAGPLAFDERGDVERSYVLRTIDGGGR